MDVEEEIGEGPFKARTPAFVNSKASASDFGGRLEIQDARAFADFPMRPGLEVKFRRLTPPAHFLIVGRAGTDRHARMRHVGNRQQQFALVGR